MNVSPYVLENTCKNAIEAILFCLEHATKGTIYTVGPMPELQAMKITSGIRCGENGKVKWGLLEASDYNPPGKSWVQYRDNPGQVLEAMGCCVEQQKSWTAEDPHSDIRSVRKQLRGEAEDWHHMEPVLVKKADVYGDQLHSMKYPQDWQGNPIWQGTEYVVVAIIKIHFLPHTIQRGDRSTKIIEKLSQTLGTELSSLFVRESYLEAQEQLSRERLHTCNVIAHELRNTLAKLGFVFSAINAVMSILREQWEHELQKTFPLLEDKMSILGDLNELLILGQSELNGQEELVQLSNELKDNQDDLANLFPLPQQGEKWLRCKIRPKWDRLFMACRNWERDKEKIGQLLQRLEKAIWVVVDTELPQKMSHLPQELRTGWPKFAYTHFPTDNSPFLEEILQLFDHRALCIPHKEALRRALAALKALVEVFSQIEEQSDQDDLLFEKWRPFGGFSIFGVRS